MDYRLCQRAAALIGHELVSADRWLTVAVHWCDAQGFDFRLRSEDGIDRSKRHWTATFWIDGHEALDGSADNPHDALARLIAAYHEWKQRQEPAQPKGAEECKE